jgi:hypothetical protein
VDDRIHANLSCWWTFSSTHDSARLRCIKCTAGTPARYTGRRAVSRAIHALDVIAGEQLLAIQQTLTGNIDSVTSLPFGSCIAAAKTAPTTAATL